MTDRDKTPDELITELNLLRKQLGGQQVFHPAADLFPQILLILDSESKIVASNNAWESLLSETLKFESEKNSYGQNYFDFFSQLVGGNNETIKAARLGFQSVIEGKIPAFDLEYQSTKQESRWFLMRLVSISLDNGPGVIVTHNDITQLIRTTVLAGKLLGNHVSSDHFEFDTTSEELRLLGAYTHLGSTSVTAKFFGQISLNKSYPTLFKRLVDDFDMLASKSVENQIYKTDAEEPPLRTDISTLSEKMGALNAGPRDVVEVYLATLKNKSITASPAEMTAYVDEAKLLVLELMGHLVSFYRNYSIGVRAAYASPELLRTID
ncbi:MAG: hypothetical protein HGB19_10720, partial [Chlorobiales bacterium]|nr:hypothetical protein [Chlorobiales bacterium]